jgi:hypothetical protein
MPRHVREGNVDYLVYSPQERRQAGHRAVVAAWLLVIWIPLFWLVYHLLSGVAVWVIGFIGVVLVGTILQSFEIASSGRVRDDGD